MSAPRVLGVIGARAGSKSLPNKNIRPLCGRPLFAWIADAAKQSASISRIIMSTDSPEYAEAANREGVETPFLRPVELAQDGSSDFDYLYHATTWLRDHEAWQADIILRLPPTSPLCTPEHIDSCVRLLTDDVTADSARTVCEASKHPYKLWRAEGEYLVPFMSEEQIGLKDAHNLPRQSFPLVYQHVDVIALRWQTLVEQKSMAGTKIRYNVVPKTESVDIDNEVDFLVAEQLLRRRM